MKINDFYCCSRMKEWIEDEKCTLRYRSYERSYGVMPPKSLMKKYEVWKGYKVFFCPACGTKLPSSLASMRFAILKKEYGLDGVLFDDKKQKLIPREFMTDEWWKKRGL
jgi:hypothetical protein